VTLAQAWLEAAYNRSSANDAGKLAQDPELLDHLNRIYQRIYALFAKARPDEAGSLTTLALIGAPATGALPADLIALLSVRNALGNQVHVIPAREALRLWHMAPSVIRRGNALVSRAKTGDPVAGDVLTLEQLDAPASLATGATAIDARFPTRHHQVCVDALALYLSTKDDGRDAGEHAKLGAEFGQALAAFAAEYELPPSALEWAQAPATRSSGPAAEASA
jgi:hypothetical protein